MGKKHKMACAFSEKEGKSIPSFSSLWKIENVWGRPIEEFASQKLRGSTLLTWLHHCSVLLLMSWLNAYFSISASLSSCLNFCIIWNFGQLTITFIFILPTFLNIHFNKFFIIIFILFKYYFLIYSIFFFNFYFFFLYSFSSIIFFNKNIIFIIFFTILSQKSYQNLI